VTQPGEQALNLGWSARGTPGPARLRFELALPPSPIACLDLELPANLIPVLPQTEVLLAQVSEAPDGLRTWRVCFGGMSRLEISLRPATPPSSPPRMLADLSTRQDLSPGLASCQFNFDFKVLRGDLTDLVIEFDPSLTVADVAVHNLESWRPLPGRFNGNRRISIRLREPTAGGQLRVTAATPIPFNESVLWTSPTMQLIGALSRTEKIRVQLSADLRLAEWRPGSFRITGGELTPEQAQVIALEASSLLDGSGAQSRPSARFRSSRTEFQVHQAIEWNVGSDRSTLTSKINVDVQRGTLCDLTVRLPPGWEVDRVDALPKELSPTWRVIPGPNTELQIQLQQPLTAGAQGEFQLELHQLGPMVEAGRWRTIAFPDPIPLRTFRRQGELTVNVSAAYAALAPRDQEDSELVGPDTPATSDAPAPNWRYRFHGFAPVGPLHLTKRPTRLAASLDTKIALVGSTPQLTTRLLLTPKSGAPESIVLWAAAPIALPWLWRSAEGTNQVVSVQSLPVHDMLAATGVLGMGSPLGALARTQAPAAQRWYRLTFDRPLDSPVTLESTYEPAPTALSVRELRVHGLACLLSGSSIAALSASGRLPRTPVQDEESVAVPLLRVAASAGQIDRGVVSVPTSGGISLETRGLIRQPTRANGDSQKQVFLYRDGPMSLLVNKRPSPIHDAVLEIDGAELICALDESGSFRCLFTCRVRNLTIAHLNLRLPAGARVEDVAIAGRLLAAEQCRIQDAGGRVTSVIPAPVSPTAYRVEILFVAPAQDWFFSTRLEPPVPEISETNPCVSVVWRLPPGILPMSEQNLVRLPGGPNRARHLKFPPISQLHEPSAIDSESYGESPRRSASAKEAPAQPGRTFLQALLAPGPTKPVLDMIALAEAGVAAATRFPSGATWESIGLVAVTFQRGTVLTTPRQRSIWRADSSNDELPASIATALADAFQTGQDASGRFRTVADWAESPPLNQSVLLARLGGDGPDWTAWESREATPSRIQVANTGHAAVAGWLIAATLIAVSLLSGGRTSRRGQVLLLVWLMAAGIGVISLPEALSSLAAGPMLASLLVAVISVGSRKRASAAAAPSTRQSTKQRILASSSVRALSMVVVLSAAARAAAPEPATVYLVPGPPQNPDPTEVLVPAEVMERLKLMSQPRLVVTDSVFYGANYVGRSANAGSAEFEAHFELALFVEKSAIAIPLGDVRLREVLLDGAVALPRPAGADHFVIDVSGKGEHRVDVKFETTVGGNGPDREVRFSTPELSLCRLEFSAPAEAEQLHAVNWRGAQIIAENGKFLKADLGRSRAVNLHWRQAGKSGDAQIRVQEASLWDIDTTVAMLRSVFDFRVVQGSIGRMRVQLPPDVAVSRVEVRPDDPTKIAPSSWVKDWSVNSERVLMVEFQASLTGTIHLLLECVPSRPLSLRPTLQFPSVLDVGESDYYAALRLRGAELAPDFERHGVTDLSTESFLRDVWRPARAENSPAPVTRAFRRTKKGTIVFRPTLRPAQPSSAGTQELIGWFGAGGIRLRGTAQWTAAGQPLTFVEWEVPPAVVIDDVRGLGLHYWTRAGGRVQVWLREPRTHVNLVWFGRLPRSGPITDSQVFEWPAIRLAGVGTQSSQIRLRAAEGWAVGPENAPQLGPSIAPTSERELAFQVSRLELPIRIVLHPPQPNAVFRTLSVAEVAHGQVVATTYIDPLLRRDRPHSFILSVRDAVGWQVSLIMPTGCGAIARPSTRGSYEWNIEVPPREVEALSIRLVARKPLGAKQDVALPSVAVRQGGAPVNIDRRFVLLGPELRAGEMVGLRRTNSADATLAPWPAECKRLDERGGSVWLSDGDDVQPTFTAALERLDTAPAGRIFLGDIKAAPLGSRWLFRASFDLLHEPGARLDWALPPKARAEGAALDGELLPNVVAGKLSVTLPVEAKPRRLFLVWTASEPQWEPPRINIAGKVIAPDTVVWTAYPLPGERIEVDGSLDPVAADIRRAESLLALAREATPSTDNSELLRRIAARLLLAEAELNGPSVASGIGDRISSRQQLELTLSKLDESAQSLRVANAPAASQESAASLLQRDSIFDQLPYGNFFHGGPPTRWVVAGAASMPEVKFRPANSPSGRSPLTSLGLALLAVFAFGLLALMLPFSTRLEQLALIGLFGFAVFGIPVGTIFVLLTGIAMLIRVIWFGNRAVRWLGA
jgi:hypothetical protein